MKSVTFIFSIFNKCEKGISKHWILLILFIKENKVTIKDLRIELMWIPFALNSSVAKHIIFFNFLEYISYKKLSL